VEGPRGPDRPGGADTGVQGLARSLPVVSQRPRRVHRDRLHRDLGGLVCRAPRRPSRPGALGPRNTPSSTRGVPALDEPVGVGHRPSDALIWLSYSRWGVLGELPVGDPGAETVRARPALSVSNVSTSSAPSAVDDHLIGLELLQRLLERLSAAPGRASSRAGRRSCPPAAQAAPTRGGCRPAPPPAPPCRPGYGLAVPSPRRISSRVAAPRSLGTRTQRHPVVVTPTRSGGVRAPRR